MADDKINSVIDEAKIQRQFDKLFNLLVQSIGYIKEVNNAAKGMNFGNGFRDMADALKNARAFTDSYKQARADATRQESLLQQEILKTKGAYEALKLAEAQAAAEKRKNKPLITGEAGSLVDLRNKLKDLIKTWDSYGPAARKANQQTLKDIQAVRGEVGRLEAETGRFQRNVGNYPQKLVGGITGLLGQFGVIVGAGAAAKQVFDTTVRLDSLDRALNAVSKTEEEYGRNQAFLVATSERLGLNILDLTQAYKLFYAASTQSGLSAGETRKIFNSVAESAAVLKLSTEDTQGVLLAFSQILGKGKVQAEELRGQIGERVPGAFAIAARSIGVTEQQLNKMLETGQVIAKDFLPKFAEELQKTYGTSEKVEGLQASVARLSNTFTELVSDNQSGLSTFFQAIVDLGTSAIRVLDGLSTAAGYLVNTFVDPSKNKALIERAAINDIAKSVDTLTNEELLKKRNIADENIETTEKNLETYRRLYAFLEQESKKTGNHIEDSQFAEQKKDIEAAEAELKKYQKVREIFVGELKKRYPGAPESDSAAPTALTKAQMAQANRLRELQLKAELDRQKISMQDAIDSQKEIADNEKNTLAERLAATENYYSLKNIQAKDSADAENKLLDEQIKQGKAVNEQKLLVEDKYNGEKAKNTRELGKMVGGILKDNADLEAKAISDGLGVEQAALDEAANKEMTALVRLYSERRITQKQYEDEKFRIENKYAILSIQAQLEATKKILEIQKLRGVDTSSEEQKLLELQNKLRDADLEYFQKTEEGKLAIAKEYADKHTSLQKELNDRLKDLGKEVFDFAVGIGNAQFENEKNRLQAESDEVDKKKEKDIAALDSQVLSEQQKADKVTLINAQAAAQKEAIERKQRDIDVRAAQFQKAISLMNIAISTAEAIFKISAQAAVLGATPIVGPALSAQALAQIPFVVASAAVQAAAVAIAPIPHYAHGTLDHPGGPLVAGDGGRSEVMVDPQGNIYKTPATDNVYDMPEHTRVFPSMDDFYKYASFAAFRPLPDDFDSLGGVTMAKRIIDGVGGRIDNLNTTLKNKPVASIKTYTEKGIIKLTEENNSFTRYVNKYMT